jgi:SAM-dependent methyltransferase
LSTPALELEPGSFRDPDSRVLLAPDAVLRALSPRGLEDWRALAATRFFPRAVEAGKVVATQELEASAVPEGALRGEVAGMLRHERLPFVSYPYEWPFSMLRDAAALQLELLAEALEEKTILKDSSPYNVQWRGAQPVFVDVGSFEPLREGEPWVGYRQFCMLYLYPLMLQAHRGVDFHPFLRGSIDGITPAQAAALLRRDRRRAGVLKHVTLHARLEQRYDDSSQKEVRKDLKEAGFSSELIKANVKGLRKLLGKLRWEPGGSTWSSYGEICTYSEEDAAVKERFVREAARERRPRLAWDLGCNDGRYARVVAESANHVVAVDLDHLTIDRLYRQLRDEGDRKILPLVMNLADPSPGLGWRGRERRPLADRGRPDLVLALALVHHLAISANVPLAEVVDWLASLGATTVVEFPTREDPMVQRLLAGKRDETHLDYDLAGFERLLGEAFEVEARQELPGGTRVLFRVRPRGAAAGP